MRSCGADLLRRQQIVFDMDDALEKEQFELWIQPQYNHATGALIGGEVLVRWNKDGQYISPADFIEIFEQNGFIYPMDCYVWEHTCMLLQRWRTEGRTMAAAFGECFAVRSAACGCGREAVRSLAAI